MNEQKTDTANLEAIKVEYKDVVGNVPPNKSKDAKWLQDKIAASKADEEPEETPNEEPERVPTVLDSVAIAVKLNNQGLLIPKAEFSGTNMGSVHNPGILRILGNEKMVRTYVDSNGNHQPLMYIASNVKQGVIKWKDFGINGLVYWIRVNYPLELPESLAEDVKCLIEQEAKIQTPSQILINANTGEKTDMTDRTPEMRELF